MKLNKYFCKNQNLIGIFFFLSLMTHLWGINNFSGLIFDEFHYVPAATEWLEMNPTRNLEHPPLGKYLIAISQSIFGRTPLGSRYFSALFGSGCVVLLILIGSFFKKSVKQTLAVGLLSLSNIWIFVFARTAMLDIYLLFFVLLMIYCFLRTLHSTAWQDWMLFGLSTGLAVACKWSATFAAAPLFAILCIRYLKDFSSQKKIFVSGLISVAIYFLSYMPYMFLSNSYYRSLFQIITKLPIEMLDLQKSVGGTHGYLSSWKSWPFSLRPIWFTFEKTPDGLFNQGIFLIGNQIQMWLGIASIFVLSLFLVRKRKTFAVENGKDNWWGILGLISVYMASWLGWAVSSRSVTFYYYFLVPGTLYSVLIPQSLQVFQQKFGEMNKSKFQWVLSAIVYLSLLFFVTFYPILSGQLIPVGTFTKWMWLKSWI